jgi:hypothetical protein
MSPPLLLMVKVALAVSSVQTPIAVNFGGTGVLVGVGVGVKVEVGVAVEVEVGVNVAVFVGVGVFSGWAQVSSALATPVPG